MSDITLICNYSDLQPATWCNQRKAALVLGEVPAKVASQEERAQELVLRAVARGECSSAFTHTHTDTRKPRQLDVTLTPHPSPLLTPF